MKSANAPKISGILERIMSKYWKWKLIRNSRLSRLISIIFTAASSVTKYYYKHYPLTSNPGKLVQTDLISDNLT